MRFAVIFPPFAPNWFFSRSCLSFDFSVIDVLRVIPNLPGGIGALRSTTPYFRHLPWKLPSRIRFAMTSQVRPFEPHADAARALESGDVLWLREHTFEVDSQEQRLLSSAVLASGKNVSFDPVTSAVGGSALRGEAAERLRGMLSRFSDDAHALVGRMFR